MSILRDMSEDSRVQYKFMIPAELKAKLEQSARGSFRSLSAEIIVRLEDSISRRESILDDPLADRLAALKAEASVAEQRAAATHHELMRLHNEIHRIEEAILIRKEREADFDLVKFMAEWTQRLAAARTQAERDKITAEANDLLASVTPLWRLMSTGALIELAPTPPDAPEE